MVDFSHVVPEFPAGRAVGLVVDWVLVEAKEEARGDVPPIFLVFLEELELALRAGGDEIEAKD